MRIIQIIDSLETGGAERMALNYANSLASRIDFSGLIVTRKEGSLNALVNSKVNYLFLNKKKTIDFSALFELRNYCKKNKIELIQAHSSSYFLASLVKISLPSMKVVWHDHNGGIVPKRKGKRYIQLFSVFFNGVISVNQELKNWALKKLYCKNVIYISNYSMPEKDFKKETILGGSEGKKILCLANLRIQKNHFLLLKVAKKLLISHPDWSFHFVGKDFEDNYSDKIKSEIIKNNLENTVFLYGSKSDTDFIISQADIAVFSSNTEGLPVSLLEYGLHKKPVLSTKVGEIPLIIIHNENGFLVDVDDENSYYQYLIKLIDNQDLRTDLGDSIYHTILNKHSEKGVINTYLNWVKTL